MDNQITKTENKNILVDPIKFLSQIESADTISKKFKIFNKVLNQEPFKKKNFKDELKRKGQNAGVAQDYDYVPIEIIEESLRQIFFNQVDFIIKNSYRDLNTMVVVASIQYNDPVSGRIRIIDGIGAKSIQQDSGAKIIDFNSTMKQNGLELAVGSAYSKAIKNAAKKLGKAFGADLNRDEELESVVMYNKTVLSHGDALN